MLRPRHFSASSGLHLALVNDTKTWWCPGEQTAQFGPSLPKYAFPGILKPPKCRKRRGLHPFEPQVKGGIPPLKTPRSPVLVGRARQKIVAFTGNLQLNLYLPF